MQTSLRRRRGRARRGGYHFLRLLSLSRLSGRKFWAKCSLERFHPPAPAFPMTSARRVSNGRSPLVRKQSQITSFFSPGKVPKVNSVLASTPKAASTTPKKRSPEPITGLSPEPNPPSKRKKSVLAVGHTPLSSSTSAEQDSVGKPWKVDVVGRRLKVFWPLDKAWYEGCVKSFDVATGKHVVQYDDAEEEVLDLGDEKIEWLDEETPRSFRRLRRRISISALVSPADVSFEDGNTGDQSTEDEDWGAASGEKTEDDSGDSEVEEDDEEEGSGSLLKKRRTRAPVSGKRKEKETEKVDSVKQARSFVNVGRTSQNLLVGGSGTAVLDGSCTNVERKKPLEKSDNATIGDVAERFGKREAEKFGFLREGRKDGNRRRPGDANYNPKTLYLPPDFLKSLSGGQRQWWEFKSKHMDKVLFFKMGKFYELFEMDAHIGVKELDLQYMKGEQPHCGFPEKNFSINLEKLVRKGYRVLVIEQTETPEQLERRRKEMGAKDKVVKREICAVVSKGTLTEGELLSTSADALYLLSLTEKCLTSKDKTVLGVCVVDVSTSKFMIGQFEDDCERQCFSSMLSELRPVEIIKPSKQLSPETERALQRHTRCPLVNEFDPCAELWDAVKTIDEVTNIYKIIKNQRDSGCPGDGDSCNDAVEDSLYLPDVLCGLLSAGENGCYALSAFGGCLYYLRESLLDKSLLSCATFELLPFSGVTSLLQKRYMILDAPAFENLEILENRNGGFSGTLFSLLDHCATAFGKRMLKAWLARPLYDLESIVERQDAIAYFKAGALSSVLEFRKELTKLPDMERLLARLFSSCEANGRNASKVVLYEDASKKQLHDFISALSGCEAMSEACSSLSAILTNTESSLLHRLLSPGHKLPDVHSIIKHFREAFDWAEADSSGRIVPCVGVDAEYDAACTKISAVETNFARYLKEQRKALGDSSINYVTVGKELYLLEVPECSREMLSQEYELRSSRKGYFRYWTPKIKNWLDELSQAEDEKESKLRSILQLLIKQFGEYQNMWRQLVSVTAELDVLLSLAMATNCYEGPACRPVIKASPCSSEAVPSLCARTLSHPIIHGDALGKGSFVPNDINIGGMSQPCFILLSGPNMGGKSTLLRQICLAVVLAQIGADVPAESFELSPVDRIFVRMGARDHIMAGQSTFLTELVETASMLNSASCNSLVVLDELGRGTSTSDGQAIADAVLDYFIHNIHCRGLFSTHYHHLAIIYESKPEVSLRHMACQVGKGVSGVEEVTFLYRMTPGSCPKSYGVNVARLAGLPNSVLQRATAKSREFEATYGQKKGLKNNNNSCDDQIGEIEREIFKNLIRFTMSGNSDGKANKLDMRFLTVLQQRAILQVAAT